MTMHRAMTAVLCAAVAMLAAAFTPAGNTIAAAAQDQPRMAGPFDASLPIREGTVELAGLAAPVTVARDDLGVPVIAGESMIDVYRAQGFIHAQERFFQMDLGRRYAAGELAELIGPSVVGMDRGMRPNDFRRVAQDVFENLSPRQQELANAYTAGVNAGLDALGASPPEYMLLRQQPSEWKPADSILVVLSMFSQLHYNEGQETRLAVMQDALPKELYDLLTPLTTRFDAPMLPSPDNAEYEPVPIPGPDIVNLREGRGKDGAQAHGNALLESDGLNPAAVALGAFSDASASSIASFVECSPLAIPGSNSWAVAGARSAHGGAIVANDPHLGLSAPGVWYRVQLEWPGRRIVGVSLPGLPGITIGSNGRIAWSSTNTTADFQDLIVIEVNPDDPNQHRTPEGEWESFGERVETINVAGGEPVELRLQTTRWGPIHDNDHLGRPRVLKWVARDPLVINLDLLDLMTTDDLETAVDVIASSGGPSQNYVLADDQGRIAWVVSGYLPKREGFTGNVPVSWAKPGVGWAGSLEGDERPAIIAPANDMLFTANNRTMSVEQARWMGSMWAPATRASRIQELLEAEPMRDEPAMLAMQLDNRVKVLDFYRDAILRVIPEDVEHDTLALAAARKAVADWNGTSDADQVGMAILHRCRRTLRSMLIRPLVAPCRELSPSFTYLWQRDEEVVRRLFDEEPLHLLDPQYESYDDLLRSAFEQTVRNISAGRDAEQPLPTWGELNVARIQHPASDAAPAMFRNVLNMPASPLSGYYDAVRVNVTSFGASCRLVVSPGREERGILEIPAGQSGHPWSPDYRSSHDAWLKGEPTPLLAGEAVATLMLTPAGDS